jgi:Fur family ferric uptake transcriptional regulator
LRKDVKSMPPKYHTTSHSPRSQPAREVEKDDPIVREAWERFCSFLHGRGERVTEPRRIVLSQALSRDDHFRADDLAADLSYGSDRVSRGTVYRTLALLVQAGLLRELRDSDTHVHYEAVFGRKPHEHLICDGCGKFIEVEADGLAGFVRQLSEAHDFDPRAHRLVVFGRCESCR